MACWAIIAAAGVGERAGCAKQFAELAGQSVLCRAVQPFVRSRHVDKTKVMVAAGMKEQAQLSLQQLPPELLHRAEIIDRGGDTRMQTVQNGLDGLADDDWAIVHDGARPCLSDRLLEKFICAMKQDPTGGLLATPVADTLKESAAEPAKAAQSNETAARSARTLSRNGKYLAQTPQMFRAGALRLALSQAGGDCSDEAQAMEQAGHDPLLFPGDATNIKITHAEDFVLAAAVLSARSGV